MGYIKPLSKKTKDIIYDLQFTLETTQHISSRYRVTREYIRQVAEKYLHISLTKRNMNIKYANKQKNRS